MMKSLRTTATLAGFALALLSAPANAQVDLQLLADVNLAVTANITGGSFIGNNPSAVAWDGSTAWVGGYNSSGGTANTAIVPITNVLTSASIGSAFGEFNTNNSRGLTALAVQNGLLAAAIDNGSGNANSIRAFDAGTGALNWAIGDAGAGNDSSRRGNGVAFDPGFNGGDATPDVAYLSIGSGRRHRLNAANGTYVNGQNAGAIINHTGGNTVWRGLDFDPDTGDFYARESNRLIKGIRTGDNLFTTPTDILPTGLATAAAVDNENLAFVKTSSLSFVILNDRPTAGGGQAFATVLKAFGLDGSALTIDFNGFSAPNGNGAYNFSYHAPTQTLAVSDFANRRLYVFGVNQLATTAPEPGSVGLFVLGGLLLTAVARRRS